MNIEGQNYSGSETYTPNTQADRYANNMPQSPKDASDPYSDKEAVSSRIDYHIRKDRYTRWIFEREWFRNVLYYLGRQWIIYDMQNRRWRPKTLPIWFPQPYTNKFAEKTNDIVASYEQGRLPITYSPADGDDPEHIAVAETAERFRDVLYDETNIEEQEALMASWIALTANVFIHTYFDYAKEYGEHFIQDQQCQVCGQASSPADISQNDMTCPKCQQGQDFVPAMDPETDEPQGEKIPKGKLKADIVSPFEIRLDPTIPDFSLQRRFTRVRAYDIEFARMYWKNQTGPDGEPIDVKKIVADKEGSIGQFYLDALSYMTASFGAGGGFIAGGGSSFKLPRVSAYEYYELPSDDFPEGLHAIRLGHTSELVVVAEPLDTRYGAEDGEGAYFLPLVHIGADRVPGRLWRKTRMDDLIPLQNFRNLVEAALKLTAQRTGNPLWLNPKGSGVMNMTGEPGQWVDYNPVSVGGTSFAKPERIPADLSNVQGFTVLLKVIDDSMEKVAGTFFLQGGETPPGVTAASALAYLGEKAQQAISPLKREWAKGWKRWELQALEIARQHWDDDRIKAIAGENRVWETDLFMKSDLQNDLKLAVDYQGLFRKSQASKRADIQMLIQMGVIMPEEPETQWEILKAFGETSLKGSTDMDRRQASIEFMDFADHGIPPKIVPMVQNSPIHILQHTDDAKTDKFKALPMPMQQVWYQHIQAHVFDIMARNQVMNSPAGMGPGAGPGAPPPPGGPPGGGAAPPPKPGGGEPQQPGEKKVPGPIKKGVNRAQMEIGNPSPTAAQ